MEYMISIILDTTSVLALVALVWYLVAGDRPAIKRDESRGMNGGA